MNSIAFRKRKAGPLIACAIAYGIAIIVAILVWRELSSLHPIYIAFTADIAATLVVFLAGTALTNSSLYDPYWTVAPPLLALFYMLQGGSDVANDLRGGLVFVLVMFWAGRLTFNCFRRWENLDHEDFRYIDFRRKTGSLYPLVDLFGIQLMPTVLVFLGCLPLYPVFASQSAPINILDGIAFLVLISAVSIEAMADEQLTEFKRTNNKPGNVCKTGLWAWSRHPNYVGEIGFWWGLWFFALACGPQYWWTGIGALAITLLFVFISIPMIEKRKAASRPDYKTQVAAIPKLAFKKPNRVAR